MKRDRSHEMMFYILEKTYYMLLPRDVQLDLVEIAKRIPGLVPDYHMHTIRDYLTYEWQIALQFILDHAMQFDRLVERGEHELRALHRLLMNTHSSIQLIEDTEPDGFVVVRFMDVYGKSPAQTHVTRDGVRTFKCELFTRTDCTLQERRF